MHSKSGRQEIINVPGVLEYIDCCTSRFSYYFLSDTVEIVRDVICALQCGAWLCCVAANYFRYQHFLIRCILREK